MSRYVVHPAKEQNTDPRYFNRNGQTISGLSGLNSDVKIPLWAILAGAGIWAVATESGKKTVKKLRASL